MDSQREKFIGLWRLVEWSVTDPKTGKNRFPFRAEVTGHLLYTGDGWVSATLMEVDRKPLPEQRLGLASLRHRILEDQYTDLSAPERETLNQYFLAGFGYVNYSGTFSLDPERVHHHVETSLIPQWVGTTLIRHWIIDDATQTLILTAKSDTRCDELIWRRS